MSLFCGEADYQRTLRGNKPSYAWRKWVVTDGGTTGYQGLGYTVLRIHSFHGDPQVDDQGVPTRATIPELVCVTS